MGRADSATWRRFLALAAIAGALLALPAAAIAAQGQLYSFGFNYYGELGVTANNKTSTGIPTPQLVTLPGATGPVVQAGAGGNFGLALTASGQVYGFGENFWGQLGTPTNNGVEDPPEFAVPNPTPALISFPANGAPIVDVSAGSSFGLAVTSTGRLYSFGNNGSGALGRPENAGTANANPTPALVSLPGATGPVVDAEAGFGHSLALTATGQLYAFGSNYDGELGNATNNLNQNPNPTPALVALPGATGPVAQAVAGFHHTLALTSTGQLYAFGWNFYGQLGIPTNAGKEGANPTPALVTLPGATGPPVQISAGSFYSLVLTSTGQLYSFGDNDGGQLGRPENAGTAKANPTPTLVSLPGATGPVVNVVGGNDRSFAITSTGQLFAFGSNRYGQLGITTNFNSSNPNPTPTLVQLPGGAKADTAAPGFGPSLVVVADVSVATGSLADGTAGQHYSAGVEAAGGTAPLRWSASGLPAGLAIGAGGEISGTPTEAGGFNPTVTVSDRYGVTASRTLALTIQPGAESSSRPGLTEAPRLLALKASRRSVSLAGRRVGGKCVAVTAANRDKPSCRRKLELSLGLTLDADATVTVELARLTPGRLVRGRCLKPTDANRKRPSCSRASAVGKPRVEQAQDGADRLTISGPALAPGRYEVTVTPYAGGQEGDFKTTRFTVTA